jgi:hypothetical protein
MSNVFRRRRIQEARVRPRRHASIDVARERTTAASTPTRQA